MRSIATYLLGYLVVHILLISIVEAFFCVDLKLIVLGLIVLVFGVAVVNSKKIILEKSDIIIVFVLAFLNIYYTFIELRGLIFFRMTYVLFLAILLSKVILPNISLKSYLGKIDTIYFIVLIGLVIEYLILLFFGDQILADLFMCHGEETGVRGYIPQSNITREFLPHAATGGLNSIMLGSQTATQLAVIIFVWYLYKFKASDKKKHLALGLLAIFMLILSPSFTSIILLFISIVMIYLLNLSNNFKEKIKNFYKMYLVLFVIVLLIYLLARLFTYKYFGLNYIYDEYIVKNLIGFQYFDLKDILFGIPVDRQTRSFFPSQEISFLKQLTRYGFVGIGVFYISIFYYMLRALRYRHITALVPNMMVMAIFVLGNIHYPVMFNMGPMLLFVLHLAYIIYQGSDIKNN